VRKATVFVLLLKRGVVFGEECVDGEEFATAEHAGAGILGVFETPEQAAELMRHRLRPGIEISPKFFVPTADNTQ